MREELVKLLIERGLTISTAESMTGGLVASSIVDISDASKVFSKGYVTYSDDAKVDMLGVNKKTIEKYGVVSHQIALEMATGLYKKTGTDICVCVTGSAGPNSYDGIEVGTVYIGFKILNKYYVSHIKVLNKGRNYIRQKTCDYIFSFLLEKLK